MLKVAYRANVRTINDYLDYCNSKLNELFDKSTTLSLTMAHEDGNDYFVDPILTHPYINDLWCYILSEYFQECSIDFNLHIDCDNHILFNENIDVLDDIDYKHLKLFVNSILDILKNTGGYTNKVYKYCGLFEWKASVYLMNSI